MKRRYTTEAQIIAAIEHTQHQARQLLERAESLELSAGVLIQIPDSVEEAKAKREEAKACRRRAELMVSRSLPRLGQKLAQFRTLPLPNMDPGPEGVPLAL